MPDKQGKYFEPMDPELAEKVKMIQRGHQKVTKANESLMNLGSLSSKDLNDAVMACEYLVHVLMKESDYTDGQTEEFPVSVAETIGVYMRGAFILGMQAAQRKGVN